MSLDYEAYKRLKTKVSLVGEDIITKDGNATGRSLIGFVFSLFMFIQIMVYGMHVMRGVIEEKANRIVEVIISVVKPMENWVVATNALPRLPELIPLNQSAKRASQPGSQRTIQSRQLAGTALSRNQRAIKRLLWLNRGRLWDASGIALKKDSRMEPPRSGQWKLLNAH